MDCTSVLSIAESTSQLANIIMAPKKQKGQAKAVMPELSFDEALGKELSTKFMSLVRGEDDKTPLSKYFASSISSDDDLPLYTPDSSGSRVSTDSSLADALITRPDLVTSTSKSGTSKDARALRKSSSKKKTTYRLDDLNASQCIERLVLQYGRMTHMGVRDHSYQFFLNGSRTGAISYRLIGKVAVISGDPICPLWQYRNLLGEFEQYCKANHWKFAMTGCSGQMADIAKELGWTTIHVAQERVINVQTNPVLLGSEGKRIRTQCKQLMKSGTTIGIYSPAHQHDILVEERLSQIYEDWRAERNATEGPQAYVTVFDMFSISRIMTFVYTQTSDGTITGFAALRKMKNGYHIDPCIATSEASRGTVDLLLISSIALLKEAGAERLVLGVEPLADLGDITGMSKTLERLTRRSHRLVTAELPLGGKKGFHDRFRPDGELEEHLYLIYPNPPGLRQQVAIAHFSHVELHKAFKQRYSREFDTRVKIIWRRRSDHATSPIEAAAAA